MRFTSVNLFVSHADRTFTTRVTIIPRGKPRAHQEVQNVRKSIIFLPLALFAISVLDQPALAQSETPVAIM
jgi:hypothetical protein